MLPARAGCRKGAVEQPQPESSGTVLPTLGSQAENTLSQQVFGTFCHQRLGPSSPGSLSNLLQGKPGAARVSGLAKQESQGRLLEQRLQLVSTISFLLKKQTNLTIK